jgi:hypothetical protein
MSVPMFFYLKKSKSKSKSYIYIYIYISHAQSVNGPQEDVATFSYKRNREVEYLGIPLYFGNLLEPTI